MSVLQESRQILDSASLVMESDVAFANILTEAVLNEEEAVEKKDAKKFAENVKTFFAKVVAWLKDQGAKLKGKLTQVKDKLEDSFKSLVSKVSKFSKDVTKEDESEIIERIKQAEKEADYLEEVTKVLSKEEGDALRADSIEVDEKGKVKTSVKEKVKAKAGKAAEVVKGSGKKLAALVIKGGARIFNSLKKLFSTVAGLITSAISKAKVSSNPAETSKAKTFLVNARGKIVKGLKAIGKGFATLGKFIMAPLRKLTGGSNAEATA